MKITQFGHWVENVNLENRAAVARNTSIYYAVDGYLYSWKAPLIGSAEGVVRLAPVVRFTPLSPTVFLGGALCNDILNDWRRFRARQMERRLLDAINNIHIIRIPSHVMTRHMLNSRGDAELYYHQRLHHLRSTFWFERS